MEHEAIHELTAAYALDALDEADERDFERHLAHCDRCQEELARLSEATTALALGADGPPPPPRLRKRILAAAEADRPAAGARVVPLRSRYAFRAVTAFAAVAACTAIGLGLWAASLRHTIDRERSVSGSFARAVPLSDGHGRMLVTKDGDAVLDLARLRPPSRGHVYEIWVLGGANPVPAGFIHAGDQVVRVQRPVSKGATVAVTLEPKGGSKKPSAKPIFFAQYS